jgi:archaellum component FlaC
MTIDERLDRLTGIVESLASSVVEHDDQIEGLIKIAQKHDEEIARLRRSSANIERLLEAYLKRLPPQ